MVTSLSKSHFINQSNLIAISCEGTDKLTYMDTSLIQPLRFEKKWPNLVFSQTNWSITQKYRTPNFKLIYHRHHRNGSLIIDTYKKKNYNTNID